MAVGYRGHTQAQRSLGCRSRETVHSVTHGCKASPVMAETTGPATSTRGKQDLASWLWALGRPLQLPEPVLPAPLP